MPEMTPTLRFKFEQAKKSLECQDEIQRTMIAPLNRKDPLEKRECTVCKQMLIGLVFPQWGRQCKECVKTRRKPRKTKQAPLKSEKSVSMRIANHSG